MKITKVSNRIGIGIGTRIKVLFFYTSRVRHMTIISISETTRLYTDAGYYVSKDFTIESHRGIIATWKPVPFKRFKFRYKR